MLQLPCVRVTTQYKIRDSSVGIVTGYWLDGPRIESRWGRDITHPSRRGPGAHQASYTMGTDCTFRGYSDCNVRFNHPTPPISEVKERVKLPLYSYFGTRPVTGRPLPFLILSNKKYRCVGKKTLSSGIGRRTACRLQLEKVVKMEAPHSKLVDLARIT